MSMYKVKSNLQHDGKAYEKGDEVELDEKQAKQLLQDGVVVDPNEKEDEEEKDSPQPSVNNVKRKGDDVEGEAKVEPGAKNETTGDDQEGTDEKLQFKVLQSLEYPQGTAHEVDAVIKLTQVEADGFAEGLIELVDDDL